MSTGTLQMNRVANNRVASPLHSLARASADFGSGEPVEVGELEATTLDGYHAGLHDAGWSGNEQAVRRGYLLLIVLWMGATLPGWADLMLPEASGVNVQAMYGRSADEVLSGWVTLAEFILERAGEARQLINTLGLALAWQA